MPNSEGTQLPTEPPTAPTSSGRPPTWRYLLAIGLAGYRHSTSPTWPLSTTYAKHLQHAVLRRLPSHDLGRVTQGRLREGVAAALLTRDRQGTTADSLASAQRQKLDPKRDPPQGSGSASN